MKLPIILKLPFLLFRVSFDLVCAAVGGILLRPKGWSWKRNLLYTLLRSLIKYDLFANLAKLTTTMDVYRAYMKEQKIYPDVVMLDAGTVGGWIGSSEARTALMYFHGGSYVSPAHPKHMDMLGDLVAAAQEQGLDFSVFVVQYGLAPEAQYPLPTIQAATALQYLIDTAGRDPENIYVAGDSAGGNLAIQLLSTLSHSHTAVPKIDLKGKKLGGAFLFSPWLTFDDKSPSMRSNSGRDYLSQTSLAMGALQYLGGAKIDSYNVPMSASGDWWQNLKVRDICVVGGEYEMFIDDIEAWTKIVKIHNPQTEYYLAPAEVHIQPVVDRAFGLDITKSEKFFRHWILKRLQDQRYQAEIL